MSRTERWWRQARARVRARRRAELEALQLAEVELAIAEFEDVPDGDHASREASIMMEVDARTRHHRGRRRDIWTRRADRHARDFHRRVAAWTRSAFMVSPGERVEIRVVSLDFTKGPPF